MKMLVLESNRNEEILDLPFSAEEVSAAHTHKHDTVSDLCAVLSLVSAPSTGTSEDVPALSITTGSKVRSFNPSLFHS